MEQRKKVEFFATVIKILARNGPLTLGQIAHKTRAMRKPRRIMRQGIFTLMEEFTEWATPQTIPLVHRVMHQGCLKYAVRSLDEVRKPAPVLPQFDLVESGAENQSEAFKKLVEDGRKRMIKKESVQ